MEETYVVSSYGFKTEHLEALSPEHAVELYADMYRLHDSVTVTVKDEGDFLIRIRHECYAVRVN